MTPAAVEIQTQQFSPTRIPAPIWLWPNLLSLDAPIIAIVWQTFLSQRFSIPLAWPAQVTLGLTVWAIYLLDRLLDARRPPYPAEPLRHRFSRNHSKPMAALLAVVLATDAAIAIIYLGPAILRDGFALFGAVFLYFAAVHSSRGSIKIPKEIAVVLLFTAGTFLKAWATSPSLVHAGAALAFLVVLLANIIAIEAWEQGPSHPITRWLARHYLYWVPLATIMFATDGHNPWYASIALSAGASALLFAIGPRLSLNARRVLIDAVLLTPLVFLIAREWNP